MIKKLLNPGLFLLFCVNVSAQKPVQGEYEGNLSIVPEYKKDGVNTRLTIRQLNDTAWEWTMNYDLNMVKSFSLHNDRKDTSQWIIDEYNGIIHRGVMTDGRLQFMYSLDSVFYVYAFGLYENYVEHQLHYYDLGEAEAHKSGKFTVMDYPLKGKQHVILRRKQE
jgi:hypothetical protein